MTTKELREFLDAAEADDAVMVFDGNGNAINAWALEEIRDHALAMLDVIEAAKATRGTWREPRPDYPVLPIIAGLRDLDAALARLKETER